jgi:DNA-binding ferritin-like protein
MSAMKEAWHDLEARGHALIAHLEERGHELGHELTTEFWAWFDEITGKLQEIEAKAKADAEQVAKDAVAAEAPVANEAVQDVAAVVDGAVTGATEKPAS